MHKSVFLFSQWLFIDFHSAFIHFYRLTPTLTLSLTIISTRLTLNAIHTLAINLTPGSGPCRGPLPYKAHRSSDILVTMPENVLYVS